VRNLFRILSLLVIVPLAAYAGSQSKSAPLAAAPPQAGPAEASPDPDPQRRHIPYPPPPLEDRFRLEREQAMARQRNKDRQAALKRDTDKLLELATQLKEYVDKTNENMLSLDVIKKAEEIEKLSKSVKEKMKADEYYPAAGSNPNDRR
jgi:hypothetical protein